MAMTDKRDVRDDITVTEEPIGIIISSGRRGEPVPAFSAFVWGIPEAEPQRVGVEPRAA